MCGIAGLWRFDNQAINSADLTAMTRLLAHRGPDDAGHLFLNSKDGQTALFGEQPGNAPPGCDLALGHRRLSIIDLSPAGRQPMCNEDRSVWVVANGEIYNFQSLRQELLAKGHEFSSQSDSEVILHLYEEEGPNLVERIQGMFAFALFDMKNRRLVLARDRIGKKPLWLGQGPGFVAFASELKSLWGSGLVERELDYQALDLFMAYGYVPSPKSIFKNTSKLRPGEVAVVEAGGAINKRRYWSLDHRNKLDMDMPRAAERVRDVLSRAVADRLVSDVPLGAFLSGGLDSSLVVALMCRLAGGRVRTFSVGFGEKGYDETAQARLVAEHLGTEHTEIMVRPRLTETLPTLVWHYGEPYADSSALPTYYLSQATREHVTVALNGDGGDEFFWGYRRYRGLRLAQKLLRLPRPLLGAGGAVFGLLSGLKGHDRSSFEYGHRLLRGLAGKGGLKSAYLDWHGLFSAPQRLALYSPELLEQAGDPDQGAYLDSILEQCQADDPVERLVAADALSYLPEDLLVKVDIASMANALECRSPLLDTQVMELAAALPPGLKLEGSRLKAVLKEAARGLLPSEIIDRPKMGFGLPVGRWFKDELSSWMRHWLLEGPLVKEGWFNRPALEELAGAHLSGAADHTQRLWALVFLAQWMDLVLHGPPRPPA